jgi:hypothetical protein
LDKGTTFVGIGTSTPSYQLDVYYNDYVDTVASFASRNGTCTIDVAKGLDCSSDERLKKDVVSIDSTDSLSKILALRPINFRWNSQSTDERKHFGLIAQELETVFPELVSTDNNGYRTVAYSAFAPLLISSIQKQQDLITALQTQVQVPIPDSNIASVSSRLDTLNMKVSGWDSLFISIQSIIQSIQDSIVAIQNQLGLVQNDVSVTKDQVASLSASLANMNDWKEAMSTGSAVLGATDSAMLEKVATVSSLLVKDKLQVDGKATMFDLSVLNKLTAGTIVLGAGIDGDEINSSTGIRFQTLAQGPIDFMNGKVVINVDGSVEMTHLKLSTADPDKTTLGTATIPAGHTSMTINNASITGDSMVFITPTSFVDKPIYVNGKIPGVGFVVTVSSPAPQDIQFQWMIVN